MTHLLRRRFIAALFAPALGLASLAACADTWPSRPIELVVPYAPGGASDIIVRTLAPSLQKELGASIVVVNRAGANTAIAGGALARSRPDGYTLMLADVALLLNAAVRPQSPGYDVERDFTPISLVGSAPLVLFAPAADSRTLEDFLARARTAKGVNIANAGAGSLGHLAAELLRLRTRTTIVSVPYKGSGLALNETMAGQVDATFTSTASGMPLVKSGQLRALALASPAASREFPEIPTFEQFGLKGVNALNWWGVIGPAGLPADVVERVTRALRASVETPEMRERFAALGIAPSIRPAAEFSSLIKSDLVQWRAVVKDAQITIE